MIRTGSQAGIFDEFNLRMFFQPLRQSQGIVYMPLNPQG